MPVDVVRFLQDVGAKYKKLRKTFRVSAKQDPLPLASFFPGAVTCKTTSEANSFRTQGNKYYRNEMLNEALAWYTRSVAASPKNSRELALAYANRSAVLFTLKHYVSCLLDINRALEGDYPNDSRPKLIDRKTRCLVHIRESGKNGDQIVGDETDPIDLDDEEWRNICNFDNPFLPNTSSKMKLECNKRWGRHFVATEDIEPGEILSVEEFFLTDLNALEEDYKNCVYCLMSCNALIPCHSCNVMYCSERCRTLAYNSYHRTECRMKAFYFQNNVPIYDRMAIRTLLIGTEQGATLESLMKMMPIENIFAENVNQCNKILVNDYAAILTSCRTFDQSSFKPYIELAVKTVIVLQGLSFFNAPKKSSMNLHEAFATALLVNHFYTHGKNHLIFSHAVDELKMKVYGQRFLHNLFNHSCDPNAFNIIHRRKNAIFSSRCIKKGEQIFLTYCGSFASVHKILRVGQLSSAIYNFKCCCEACNNNWPIFSGLIDRGLEYVVGNLEELFEDLMNLVTPTLNGGIQTLTISEILQIMIDIVKLIHARLKSPSVPTFMCEELLKLLITQLYCTLVPIQRTGTREKALLDNVENVVDDIYPTLNSNGGVTEISGVLEKLYINMRKRFSENRMYYNLW